MVKVPQCRHAAMYLFNIILPPEVPPYHRLFCKIYTVFGVRSSESVCFGLVGWEMCGSSTNTALLSVTQGIDDYSRLRSCLAVWWPLAWTVASRAITFAAQGGNHIHIVAA